MLPFEPSQSSSELRKCVNVVEKYLQEEAVLDVMTAFLQRGFLC